MSIRKLSQIGGATIVATLAASIVIASIGVNKIRFGGELHRQNSQIGDFIADVLPPPEYVVEPFLEASMLVREPHTLAERRERLAAMERTYNERAAHWRASDLDEALKRGLAGESGVEAQRFWEEIDRSLLPAVARGDEAAAHASYGRLENIYGKHRAHIDRLVGMAQQRQAEMAKSSETALAATVWLLAALALALVAMILGGIWFLSRRVLGPLADTARTMTVMAQGDLECARATSHGNDEIGDMTRAIEVFRSVAIDQAEGEAKQRAVVETLSQGLDELAQGNLAWRIAAPLAPEYEALRSSFNETVDRLGELMRGVAASARSVSTGASEIRAASDDLALRNEQQAASLEETAAAMNQATGMVKASADSAAEVQNTIAGTHRQASDGGAVVERAIAAMAGIEQSAQEIAQIVNVIDGIAFQTNLLALNAGVEAARAGDAGKGFAVVANEVRALAQRSADAAHDIKELIDKSNGQVAGGVALVGETGGVLEKIVAGVGEVNTLMAEIARSAESQATSMTQVNSAVGEMDRMTQQNAAMVEQSTAAARSLADEAAELSRLVGRFRTGEDAAAAPLALPALAARRQAPMVHGNLALKPPADGDWSEF